MKTALILIVLALTQSVFAQQTDWFVKLKKIQPGVSRKHEVEEIFDGAKTTGEFIDESGYVITYLTADGRFTVVYSTGACAQRFRENCSVELGTVTEILFSFKEISKRPEAKAFDLKGDQFESLQEGDNPTMHYIDKRSGLDYAVDNEHLVSVHLFHSAIYPRIKREIPKGG